jgi:hypothetical protein
MSTEEAEVVAPLDAYATAKPDEPTFTLQGGDPLAGPLVRTWAFLARRRAGCSLRAGIVQRAHRGRDRQQRRARRAGA